MPGKSARRSFDGRESVRIWAFNDRLEVLPDSRRAGIFAAEIEEISVDDGGVVAQHLIRMDDGRSWLISTELRGAGFATMSRRLHMPAARCTVSATRQSAIIEHFQQIAKLVTGAAGPDRAA